MTAFLLAMQFLTRLPISVNAPITDKQLSLSVLYYPLVGLAIGLLLFGLSLLLSGFSLATQATLLLASWILITGGLHLDGVADCADAWAGGLGDKQRSLQIMKDPHVGAIAVVTLVMLLLLKWSSLQSVLLTEQKYALFIAPLLGRCAILILMLTAPYISKQGLGMSLTQNLPSGRAKIVIFGCISCAVLTIGVMPLCAALLLLWWLRALAIHRLGGVTGDVYGASVELVEVAVLLAVV